MNIFERSIRAKLRFNHSQGRFSVEDLFDLDVVLLDSMYKKLNKDLGTSNEESLLDTKTPENTVIELKISLIKHIVESKLVAKKAAELRALNKEKKTKLIAYLADKQDEGLKNLSEEELKAKIEEL